MMPSNLFRLQLMETFGNRKHVVIRISISILLALPFIVVDMPAAAKTSGLVMVVLFTAFFGSAIAQSRLREDSRFSRLVVLPIPKPVLWLDLVLSSVVSRILPTLIVLIGFVVFNSSVINIVSLIHTTALLCVSILLLVSLGMLIGHFIHNSGQVHLFSALICGVIAFISGVIPAVQKLSWMTAITAWNPLHQFQTSLMDLMAGTITVSLSEWVISFIILGLFCLTVGVRWGSSAEFHRIKDY